ncbi:tail fiber domain-containing protein [Burkholderia cenocepacia]|nr:tail fiber domain-containing protein [Burkholderia cenocepacia]
MSSGGGGTNTVQQSLPDWMQKYVQNNYEKAQQVASNPYTPYAGEGVAPLNQQQLSGLNQLYQNGANNTGAAAVNQGVQTATGAAGYNPNQVGYNAPTAGDIQGQLNPYLKNVMDTTNQQIQQQGAIANQQTNASATGAGAFGGARQGVQNALNSKYTQQNIANADANIMNTGYQQAVAQANANAQGGMSAALANQNAGLQGNAQRLQAAGQLGALGQTQQGIGMGNAQNMIQAGTVQQQQQQTLDSYLAGLYGQQQGAGERQLQNLMAGTYGGNPGSTQTSPVQSNGLGSTLGMLGGLGSLVMGFMSDKNAKEDIQEVDPQTAVEKFKSLPVSTWKYKSGIGLGDAQHIGPMAQDFGAAFTGDPNARTINAVDAFGAQAAAIKGLAQQVAELKRGRK